MNRVHRRMLCACALSVVLGALGYILWLQPPREELSAGIATLLTGLLVAVCMEER